MAACLPFGTSLYLICCHASGNPLSPCPCEAPALFLFKHPPCFLVLGQDPTFLEQGELHASMPHSHACIHAHHHLQVEYSKPRSPHILEFCDAGQLPRWPPLFPQKVLRSPRGFHWNCVPNALIPTHCNKMTKSFQRFAWDLLGLIL